MVPTAVHCFEGSALHTFRRAKQLGILCVLDVASDHTGYVRVSREEANHLRREGLGDLVDEDPVITRDEVYAERALADYLLVGADHIRATLVSERVPDERIVTIPYGVDSERFVPADAPD